MSDSVRPHRRQPTRLPCPWDSPGKNTGVGCHFLLQCMKAKSESEVVQSCLLVTPRTAAYQAPLPMGFSRQEYWSGGAIAFSDSAAYGHVTSVSAKLASHTRHTSLLRVGTGAPKIRVCSRLTVFKRKHTENKTRGFIRLNRDKGKEPSPVPWGGAPAEGCLSRVFARTSQPAIIRHFCQ